MGECRDFRIRKQIIVTKNSQYSPIDFSMHYRTIIMLKHKVLLPFRINLGHQVKSKHLSVTDIQSFSEIEK